jgi:o-succinylbenzoate---CoA ligase
LAVVAYPPAGSEPPAAPALSFEAVTLERGAVADRVGRAAGALREAGLRPGGRVAVWAASDVDTAVALLAVTHAGGVVVPLDPRLTATGMAARVAAAGVDLLVAPAAASVPDGLTAVLPGDLDGAPVAAADRSDEAAHAVVFTSGTSGAEKGVVLTRRNVTAAVRASAARVGNGPGDAWLAVLPLFHVGGLSILWRSAAAGGTVILHRGFDAAAAAAVLWEGRATIASLVPTMLRRILDVRPGPFRGVRAVLLGGGPAPASLVVRGLDAGLPVLGTYGMTETASQAATVVPGQERQSAGTAGVALDGVEIRIAGSGVPGTTGPIEVRGAVVSPGYLGDEPRGPADWFRTGDLGRLDDAGRLVVVGRADDVIVTGGENVHPVEIEAALAALPGVAEAAVFGVPDAEWGTAVAAAVVPVTGVSLRVDDLAASLRSVVPGYKVPRTWLVVDDLPRLATGKVDRRTLAAGSRRDEAGSA